MGQVMRRSGGGNQDVDQDNVPEYLETAGFASVQGLLLEVFIVNHHDITTT